MLVYIQQRVVLNMEERRAVHGRHGTNRALGTYEARESWSRHLNVLHLDHILLHYTNHPTSIFFHNTPILLD